MTSTDVDEISEDWRQTKESFDAGNFDVALDKTDAIFRALSQRIRRKTPGNMTIIKSGDGHEEDEVNKDDDDDDDDDDSSNKAANFQRVQFHIMKAECLIEKARRIRRRGISLKHEERKLLLGADDECDDDECDDIESTHSKKPRKESVHPIEKSMKNFCDLEADVDEYQRLLRLGEKEVDAALEIETDTCLQWRRRLLLIAGEIKVLLAEIGRSLPFAQKVELILAANKISYELLGKDDDYDRPLVPREWRLLRQIRNQRYVDLVDRLEAKAVVLNEKDVYVVAGSLSPDSFEERWDDELRRFANLDGVSYHGLQSALDEIVPDVFHSTQDADYCNRTKCIVLLEQASLHDHVCFYQSNLHSHKIHQGFIIQLVYCNLCNHEDDVEGVWFLNGFQRVKTQYPGTSLSPERDPFDKIALDVRLPRSTKTAVDEVDDLTVGFPDLTLADTTVYKCLFPELKDLF